jgi:alpha-L-fucosidase
MAKPTRRQFTASLLSTLPAAALATRRVRARARQTGAAPAAGRRVAPGPFQPTWGSLTAGYKCPEWFRDAKFGIWAHWSAQCVPEQGDWYARQMYIQGHPQYEFHTRTYGHPTTFGFMEIDRLWRAERWDPDYLMGLYKRAGAKYFFALANHHDNFDTFTSPHHAWNSVNVGPKKDIIGTWSRVARQHGLRFGVTNHSAHAWHWFQTAYGYDAEGPMAGRRYDAYTLTKADGAGRWWAGLDPQELYTGRHLVIPDGITTAAAARAWHNAHDGVWSEEPPPGDPAFAEQWFLRFQDLVDQYRPDVVYFDDRELPLGQTGLDAAAHFYNSAIHWHGHLDVVLTAKRMTDPHRAAVVEDIERGVATDIRPAPWQTDTCIGDWHYKRSLYLEHRYKTPVQVIQMLIDVVSKNGNLMLNIPVRGDGTIDPDEVAFVEALASWVPAHGEAIFETRPWTVYGEGPSVTGPIQAGAFGGARDVRPYTAEDLRFTRRGQTLYAFVMDWPTAPVVIRSLTTDKAPGRVARVELVGHGGALPFQQDARGLTVTFPSAKIGDYAYALKISGLRLG